MLKNEITFALTKAMKKKDKESINTIRLILAVIKDKDGRTVMGLIIIIYIVHK